ncbi:ribosomal large subunit pseudouridine synthase B [Candidatus Saccharibacteria bacterium QS_5_54_17]|nr:MAG: ribosomal large subunit pseudouridine synthase B [Candidatus Saccharibacteria bacterium QS_5_54_17]
MRINQYLARAAGLSRRQADQAIADERVTVNGEAGELGQRVGPDDTVQLDGEPVVLPVTRTVKLHKPFRYVVSRARQGNDPTIYALLPEELRQLKPIGRLDKDSRGLLLLTNDGQLAYRLTHPGFQKQKVYQVRLDKPLTPADITNLHHGVHLDDGVSQLEIGEGEAERTKKADEGVPGKNTYQVTMYEGRNRQIRRTFAALGYQVTDLVRTQLGEYSLGDLSDGQYRLITGENES